MKQFITLLKREFWENKTSAFYAPLVISFGFIIIVFSSITKITASAVKKLIYELLVGSMPIFFLFFLPMLIAVYALNSLYEERKNKSLLFWRSMPVSDTKTVLSKVFFGVIGIPMLFIITWFLVTTLSITVNFGFTYLLGDANISETKYDFISLIDIMAAVSLGFLVLSIMMLPYYTYLTFISSISNRVPFIIATLPFIVLSFVNTLMLNTFILHEYIFMPYDLAFHAAEICIARTLENTGNFYPGAAVTLNWGREIYTLLASIVSSVTFITLAIFSRKRIQSV